MVTQPNSRLTMSGRRIFSTNRGVTLQYGVRVKGLFHSDLPALAKTYEHHAASDHLINCPATFEEANPQEVDDEGIFSNHSPSGNFSVSRRSFGEVYMPGKPMISEIFLLIPT